MPVINLLNQSAPTKSTDQNAAICENMYLVEDTDEGKYKIVAYPTPGLTVFATILSPVRALFAEHGVLYAVGSNKFYSIASNGTPTILGTLNTSSGYCKIKGINQQLIIIDGTNGYTYNIGTATFAQITDVNFTNTSIDIVCQDEWGVALQPSSQTFQSSGLSDLTSWPVLNFASTTGNQNDNVAIASLHRELWIFQEQTTEIWDNLGTANFTFGRNTSVYIEYGCSAVGSVANGDNTLFFLGKNPSGGSVVIRMNGYTPQIISTRGINYQISTYSTVSDAIGFCYQQEGHEFYVLTFPTAGKTWVYDCSTGLWHSRSSNVSSSYTRWLPSCYAFNYNYQLVGDFNSGNIYKLDMTAFTENSTPIQRTIKTNPYYASGAWIFLPRLQIDFDQTPGSQLSQVNLYVSRDGGNTFGSAKPVNPVQTADSQWRCYFPRLGKARGPVFIIQTTLNNKFIVLGAWATVSVADGG